MAQLTPNNAFPFILASSCDLADIDRSEDPAYGTPLGERLLLDAHKGAIAIVGPTRGTYVAETEEFDRRFLNALFAQHAKNIGTAFLETQRALMMTPRLVPVAQSYALLGDPWVVPLGATAITAVESVPDMPSASFDRPKPTPFNPRTTLTVRLPRPTRAHLAVYDIHGRLVRTLHSGPLRAGVSEFQWNGTRDDGQPVASGMYLAKFSSPEVNRSHKLVLLK